MSKTFISAGIVILLFGVVLIALPFVYVPKTLTEEYQVPKSEWVLGGWTGMAAYASFKDATKGTTLNASDFLNIQVNATASKHIDFSVRAINTSEPYLYYPDVTTLNINWTVPLTSGYDFNFKSTNLFTYNDATLIVTKYWIEIVYRDVTTNYRLLPFEFLYLGIVLAVVGLGLLLYFKKRKR
jgi:hypothetical protein